MLAGQGVASARLNVATEPLTDHDAVDAWSAAIEIVNALATVPASNVSGCDCASGPGVT